MPKSEKSNWILVLIGAGKLLKAVLLVVVALTLHRLSDPNMKKTLEDAFHHIRVDPGNARIHALIAKFTGISPRTLHELRLGSFIYAALFATEGTGLILRKRWAEYFTAITTSLLLPLEVWEIFHGHHHVVKVIVLLLNLAIVVYLVWRIVQAKKVGERMVPSNPYL